MSDQSIGYMASLDAWSNKSVIEPLADAYLQGPEEVIANAQQEVRRAIRTKVLESYRNGQAAGPSKSFRKRYAQRAGLSACSFLCSLVLMDIARILERTIKDSVKTTQTTRIERRFMWATRGEESST